MWGAPVEHSYQQRHYAFHYYGVAVGHEVDVAVAAELGVEPQAALASVYQVVGRLLALGQCVERVAQLYYIGIAVHPVGHARKLVDYFVLNFVNTAHEGVLSELFLQNYIIFCVFTTFL